MYYKMNKVVTRIFPMFKRMWAADNYHASTCTFDMSSDSKIALLNSAMLLVNWHLLHFTVDLSEPSVSLSPLQDAL